LVSNTALLNEIDKVVEEILAVGPGASKKF